MENNNFKDSGVEWIGKIPKNWTMHKIKYILNERNEKNDPIKSENLLSLTASQGVVLHSEKEHFGNKAKNNLEDYKLAYENDIVFNSMNAILGSIGLSKYFGCVSPVYYMLFSNNCNINIEYYNYIFQTKEFQKSLKGLGNGILDIRMRIPIDKLKDLLMPVPGINSQLSIVKYLNRKISSIEKNIYLNKHFLELLDEKRVALINQVVTKGLNPDVLMKDSGVEWIGEIPENWEVKKIKEVASVKPSNVDKKSKEEEPKVLLCNYTDVYNNEFIVNDLPFMHATASYDQIRKLSLKKGDVIITKDSESADDIGVPAIVVEDLNNVVCGYHLAVITVNNDFNSKFLFRLLESKKINDQFMVAANGITRYGLGSYPIKNSYICIPPIKEQYKISEFLDNEISKTYQIINKVESKIDLLEEYKESLIYNVVTGKVDVSGWG